MYLKDTLRNLIKKLFLNNLSWKITSSLFKKWPYMLFLRLQVEKENHSEIINVYFEDLNIKNGIFKGLKYPKFVSSGSAIYPKLLGSYESELTKVFELILSKPLTTIIDIGCAEGYYLVGFAKKIDNIKLLGIDISEMALSQTKEMLIENQIDPARISLHKTFNINLIPTQSTDRVLIICDCEGYEDEVFKDDFLSTYVNCILLIECHDFIIPNITERLVRSLTSTHHIEIISTAPENTKLDFIPKELKKLNLEEKLELLNEGRPTAMNWIYANPIHHNIL